MSDGGQDELGDVETPGGSVPTPPAGFDPEYVPGAPVLGAAFERLQRPGVFISDAVNVDPRTVRATDHTGSPKPMLPEDQARQPADAFFDGQPTTEVPPGPAMRTLQVQSTGDQGIDAMLMCRAVFEDLPAYERRRLLEYLADRYAGR